ncbi:MAG: putative toxin-antitoxin system toxin component, PIN family [Polyangiales bacterium]
MLRVVFDTNVLLSLFAFRGARFASLREAVADGRVRCLTRADCLDELTRVLRAPWLALDEEGRAGALARYLAVAERVADLPAPQGLARCLDPDDQKFVELAVTADADLLVTLDRALLALAPRVAPLRVVVPRRLDEALRAQG